MLKLLARTAYQDDDEVLTFMPQTFTLKLSLRLLWVPMCSADQSSAAVLGSQRRCFTINCYAEG